MVNMKVFIIRNAWRHADHGGAENMADCLVRELVAQGVDATLVTGSAALVNKAEQHNTPHVSGPFSTHQILTKHRAVYIPKYLYDLWRGYKVYKKLFSDQKPNIVHAMGQQDCISATAAAHSLGIPVIWTDHGELKNSLKFSFMPPFGIPGWLMKRQLKHVTALLMPNQADIAFVQSKAPHVRIIEVPNGVQDEKSSTPAEQSYDLVFASRVIREKGIFELLEAYKKLVETRPNTTMIISGEGPSLEVARKFVADNKLSNVTFTDYDDSFIPRSSLFVLPTYTEAQSLAILKSMMFETPVITTNIDGNTHFLTHKQTAYLVEPQNSDALYAAIVHLLDHPAEAQAMAARARKQFLEKSSLEAIVKIHYIPLYEGSISAKTQF